MSAVRELEPSPGGHFRRLRRLVPLTFLVILAAGAIAMGWHCQWSLETLMRHRTAIEAFMSAHQTMAIATYCLFYVAVVALSIPGAAALTVSGGVVFGTLVGGLLAVISASTGATIVFLVARSAMGEFLIRRAGDLARKLIGGFRQDAFTYLLFLRLVPIFPFWLVNLVPALCQVRLATFIAATAIGITPATFAFAFFGAGLDGAMAAQEAAFTACIAAGKTDCGLHFNLAAAATPQLIMALFTVGIVALAPLAAKHFKARRALERE
jgi:uncharacterized membrane protein YdjX (TVP38/TMEM64 family)